MRNDKRITKGEMLWSFIKFSLLILLENLWRSVWRICMWISGLKEFSEIISCVICYSLLGFLAFNVNHVLLRMHFSQSEGWKHLWYFKAHIHLRYIVRGHFEWPGNFSNSTQSKLSQQTTAHQDIMKIGRLVFSDSFPDNSHNAAGLN